jgi:hypothetical protein
MTQQEIKIGDLVRHRHLIQGTNLSVIAVNEENIVVRYANQGVFLTQELFLHEVEMLIIDEEELM